MHDRQSTRALKSALQALNPNFWGCTRPRAAPWATGKRPFRPESQTYPRHTPNTRRNGLLARRVSWVMTRAEAHATTTEHQFGGGSTTPPVSLRYRLASGVGGLNAVDDTACAFWQANGTHLVPGVEFFFARNVMWYEEATWPGFPMYHDFKAPNRGGR